MPDPGIQNEKPRSYVTLIFIAALVAGTVIRWLLRDYESGDYEYFLSGWFDTIVENGRFYALKEQFSNYTPPYLYLLTLSTYLPVEKLHAIKLISIVFDYALGWVVYLIVRQKYGPGPVPTLAFAAAFLAPTVMINSALWAQCDVIYTVFLLSAIYCFINKKTLPALTFWAVAFVFKQQSIFLLPLILILTLKKEIALKYFLVIPVVYLLSIIPSAIVGCPFIDLITIYFRQAGGYKALSLNAPSWYFAFGNVKYNLNGIISTIVAVIVVMTAGWTSLKNFRSTVAKIDKPVRLSFILILFIPFLMFVRPFVDFVLLFSRKPSTYALITGSIAGARHWMLNQSGEFFGTAGLAITVLSVLLLCYAGYLYKGKITGNSGMILRLSLLSTLLLPFLLVRMHERYFFPADILSIVFAFYFPRYWYLPLIIISVSLASYCPFLVNISLIPMTFLAGLIALSIIIVATDLAASFSQTIKADSTTE